MATQGVDVELDSSLKRSPTRVWASTRVFVCVCLCARVCVGKGGICVCKLFPFEFKKKIQRHVQLVMMGEHLCSSKRYLAFNLYAAICSA